ncbi:MAG TPA: hypothetical protein PK821_02890 [Victivallales bacterium]|nr:hypothetical protein [Victivallales bacterium]
MKNENGMLRKELSDVLLKNRSIEEEKLRFELGVLSAVSNPGTLSVSERELQMLRDLLLVRENIKTFSAKLLVMEAELKSVLTNMDTDSVGQQIDRTKLLLVLEELKLLSGNLVRILNSAEEKPNLEKCSVLEFDDKKGVLTISAGSSNGAFCGLLLRSKNKNVTIMITAVRPFVSSAMVMEGRLEEITPGMEFIPGKAE